jgi:hypothetical protein
LRRSGLEGGGVPQRIDLTPTEVEELLGRIDRQQLEPNDWPLFGGFVQDLKARTVARQNRMIAKIAAAAVRAAKDASGPDDADPAADSRAGSSSSEESSEAAGTLEPTGTLDGEPVSPAAGDDEADTRGAEKPKGHGRNGASAYRNAKHFFYVLAAGVIGAVCEACQFGKMYRYREKIIIRIIGQPLFAAEIHHHEQARCRECGRVVRASGPACVHEGIGSDYVRYDWSACAMLLVMHYFGGAPFKRMESLHEGWGIPIADANQWVLADRSDDLLLALYRALERHAIQKATSFRIDDTGSMVVATQKQIEAEVAALHRLGESTKNVRTGINATGSYWETPDGPVILFHTGRHHAGEIVDQLLRHRLVSSPKLVKSTDGASKNFDHEHADKLIEATCNAHALLKFRDVKDKYPAEYAEAGSIYKQVFDNDDKAAELALNSVDRMLYHRQHSKPLMEELKKKCEARITSKLVEPSSPLWGPLTFVVNQWDRLTRFYEEPGVPLDTNLVEQALIMPVRYLAGSFNYHTADGAVVGDHAMSLVATARANGVEPVAYLTECLRCHEDLAKRPEHYFPWVYRERLKEGESPPGRDRDPPCEVSASAAGRRPTIRGLGDLPPEIRERAARGVAAPDQNLQLAGEQR